MERVASVDDLEEGELLSVEVEGEEILLARVEEEVHAIGDVCTHQRCNLSDGWIEGGEVVCPCHHAKFDLETGEVRRPPAKEPEPTFQVEVKEGDIFLDL